jgi:hypothetical protein
MATSKILSWRSLESAGPSWHLIGLVERDYDKGNELTLKRATNSLSAQIVVGVRRFLPAVQITDLSGNSAKLLHARITEFKFPAERYAPIVSANPPEHDQGVFEDIVFTFERIEKVEAPVERNLSSKGSSSTTSSAKPSRLETLGVSFGVPSSSKLGQKSAEPAAKKTQASFREIEGMKMLDVDVMPEPWWRDWWNR